MRTSKINFERIGKIIGREAVAVAAEGCAGEIGDVFHKTYTELVSFRENGKNYFVGNYFRLGKVLLLIDISMLFQLSELDKRVKDFRQSVEKRNCELENELERSQKQLQERNVQVAVCAIVISQIL